MKWLKGYRIRLMLVGVVAAIVLGGGRAHADFTWARRSDLPVKNMQPSTSIVGGKIYVIGGWHAIGEWNPQWQALTRVDVYDPTTDTWTRKADMPTGRGHTNACVVDGKIYVIGGDSGPGFSSIPTVEVYDPVTDTWTQKADMTSRRYWFSTCAVDGIIYVIGGNAGSQGGWQHLKTVEAYDTVTDTWTTKAEMFTGRSFLATCVVDGLIYAIGGGAPGKSAVEVYDPATDTWTSKTPMPTARYGHDTVVVDGKIYAIGGWWFSTNGPIYSTVEVYDTVTDTWTKGIDIPVTTAMHSNSVVDGKIYVFGGVTAPHANEHWILTSAVYANEPIVDFNGDGIVDATDMCIMVDNWGTDNPLCDIGPMPWGDGIVDVQDLIVLAEHLFEEFPPVEVEPAE
jgi:N-acetylneuraminic acid mutarotase